MKAVVTGAAGFIGSHLTERLLQEGHAVIGIDSFDTFYDPQIKRRNIAGALSHPSFRLIEADIRDQAAMEQAIEGDVDVIVHLAARAGVRPSIEQPALYSDVNINGTVVLLEIARTRHIKKFVFASSSSVYGNNKKVPFSESDNVDFPISPYAATKKAGELICHTYHHLYGIGMTCLRFFTVYGPRQRPDLAIHKFARLIEAGKPIPIYGDGTMRRDFTYIDDIINGVVAAIDKCAGYHIYNLGESRPICVSDLIVEIEKALGKKAIRNHLPTQPGDVDQTYADVAKAQRELGYNPSTHIATGLARFVQWLRAEQMRR
ncbi:MAG: GDP-mannose 4,6-dehydratase [Sedimentisphaerales bacterium]|jgi:UDP-glucuronate 4-epimerase|nr:GDP-mannose 4,6-dehydratase [Sedimentisphaerales bacterium]HNY80693.1 GDP-mannose 4,6-dehydratase [Sedimentisphaerales bacterium]HOC64365.1 GDP-mannose 4,6-dehydratase [Sedimentisphaerales bacterium]HOH66672.1 GDP-mannose 4,6-dehydratase [Sedimentisphaerales bacterium]HPY49545.1 GDP-mannose 4,6-dehydratase [Sedimentisphaerales bacterium]